MGCFRGHGLPKASQPDKSEKIPSESSGRDPPLETVRAAIGEWPERLKASVDAEGGHFEWHYYK